MSVTLLVGTMKGAFILRSDDRVQGISKVRIFGAGR